MLGRLWLTLSRPDRKYTGIQGTFVAGIAAGATRGVAPNAKIIMLNVFGKENVVRLDFFLMAMEWAVNDIKSRNRKSFVPRFLTQNPLIPSWHVIIAQSGG